MKTVSIVLISLAIIGTAFTAFIILSGKSLPTPKECEVKRYATGRALTKQCLTFCGVRNFAKTTDLDSYSLGTKTDYAFIYRESANKCLSS